MPFSTKSYLAGVGTVVAALTVGFSGGFFLAPPTPYVEQNRLQRVTSTAAISSPAPQGAIKPEITEARSIALISAAVPAPSTQPSARTEPIPVMASAFEAAPAVAKAAEPVRATEDSGAKPEVNAEKMRAAEAKAADRKRAREQRSAERRKQREIEAAAVAVKRMLRDRDTQQVADRTASPRFGFFGED